MNLKGLVCNIVGYKLGWCNKCANKIRCPNSHESYKKYTLLDNSQVKDKIIPIPVKEIIDKINFEEVSVIKQKPEYEEL